MARQRIKRVQPVFTQFNDGNTSSEVKQDTLVQNRKSNVGMKIYQPNDNEPVNITKYNKDTKYNKYNKYKDKHIDDKPIKLGQITPNYKRNKYNKYNKYNIRPYIKYNFNKPNLEVHYEVPCEPINVKDVAIKGNHEMMSLVYDIETTNDRHTFIANNMLVHNSVYVSFDPLFKAMTEESQKKFDTDEKKLKFIEDFSRDFLNQQNNEWCENLYNPRHGHSYHEFELESIQKSQLVDKKKKYIKGVVWMKGKTYDKPKISATGIEIVKSTTPKICRTILTDLIRDMMFNSPKYKDMNDYCIYFNELLAKKKNDFFNAHFQDISNSVSIGDYKKYVIDDQDELILAPKCPVSVKAISLFNHLAHKNGKDNLRMTSGKIKYYYVKTGPKATDIDYFGFPAGLDEPWFPPCNRTICWDKNIIVPMNRFANVIHMPLLTATGEYSLSLF